MTIATQSRKTFLFFPVRAHACYAALNQIIFGSIKTHVVDKLLSFLPVLALRDQLQKCSQKTCVNGK